MRISDWSSDVCSSDLPEAPALGAIVRIQLLERNHAMRNALHLQVMVGAGHVIEQQHSTVPAAEELLQGQDLATVRSEERRVGKEGVSKGRSGWSAYH